MASPEAFFVKDQYLFFRSNGYNFALDQSKFESPFRLNRHILSPSEISSALWEYESTGKKKDKGLFLHFGYLMGFSPVELLQNGLVYRQKQPNPGNLGLYVDHIIGYMPAHKLKGKLKEVGGLKKLPPKMPTTAIRWYFPWRGNKMLLIEPQRIFEAYKIMESGKLYNLAEVFKSNI